MHQNDNIGFIFKMLMWGVVGHIEERLCSSVVLRDSSGTRRSLVRAESLGAEVTQELACYDPKNWRRTARELHKYVHAGRGVLEKAQFLSFIGPDCSKIGTDFSVAMGAIVDSKTRIAVVACPQDCF